VYCLFVSAGGYYGGGGSGHPGWAIGAGGGELR